MSSALNVNSVGISNKLGLFIMYLLIGVSGIPFFVGNRYIFPLFFIFLLGVSFTKMKDFPKKAGLFASVVMFIYVLQGLVLGSISFNTIAVVTIKYGSAIMGMLLLKEKWVDFYIKVLYHIAIISLFFFIIFFIIPSLADFFIKSICPIFNVSARNEHTRFAPNFILYTLKVMSRNSGPFWEPGGYGTFLILGVVFNYIKTRTLTNRIGKIFIISIITTFSTATYLTLFVFIAAINLQKSFKGIMILLLMIPLLVVLYTQVDFLSRKIESRLEIASSTSYVQKAPNRFSSMLYDLQTIKEDPIFGEDKRTAEYNADYNIFKHRNNGISSVAARMGIPFFIFYFLLLYLSIRKLLIFNMFYQKIFINMVFIVVLLDHFAQVLFEKPIFISLLLFSFIYQNNIRYVKV